jgi:pectin methylesterase-like acyl-CoA thioesterase
MSLVKGKFVDKTIPIQSDNDPVDVKDLARKGYVDSQAASAADAKVEDQIVDGVTTKAPSQNAVHDALALKQASLGTGTTAQFLRGDLSWQEVATSVGIAQVKIVSKGGVDATGDGTLTKPYATVGAALASITDASPTKRYLIKVQAGAYTEGAIALKANVFICGDQKEAVRISASSFSLASSYALVSFSSSAWASVAPSLASVSSPMTWFLPV